jgi:serine/threonine protein kinase
VPDGEGAGVNVRNDMRGVLPAGTDLCGYELKSILGQGAFGITYRARDIALNRDVAIKEYLPTSLALREGRTTVVPRSADRLQTGPSAEPAHVSKRLEATQTPSTLWRGSSDLMKTSPPTRR